MSTYVNHGFIPLRQASNSCHPPQTLADRCAELTWAYSLRNVFVGTQDLRVFTGILLRISDKLRCSTQSLGPFEVPVRPHQVPSFIKAHVIRHGIEQILEIKVRKLRMFGRNQEDSISIAFQGQLGSICWPFDLLIEKP